MPTKAKEQNIEQLVEMLGRSEAVFICEYRGLTVKKMTDVRSRVRKAGGEIKVAKNTLMRIALERAGLPTVDPYEQGPNAYVFAYGDVAAVAKELRDYSKEKGNEALVIKGGVMGKDLLSKDQVMALADLPSREVLIAQVVGTMAAPLRGLVTVLSGPARGLVTCLSQIKDKKENAA
ncbi:50S ribosomal protein L10 [Thermanaerovibrio velox]|nr:50S ribosomal protein L10 [Thermanaerovibrio velox]